MFNDFSEVNEHSSVSGFSDLVVQFSIDPPVGRRADFSSRDVMKEKKGREILTTTRGLKGLCVAGYSGTMLFVTCKHTRQSI